MITTNEAGIEIDSVATYCIVVAWTVERQVWDGKPFWQGCGASPNLITAKKPCAAVWLLEGNSDDVENAQRYVSGREEGGKVFAYRVDEEDPLGRAKMSILAQG